MINKQENIDYLAEVIVSHLIANKNIDDSDICVHLLGVFKRFFSKDIEKMDIRRNGSGKQEWNLFLHREGFYDLLPEGFFHSSTRKYFKDRRETIEEFRIHRREEKSARQFFMPLEQEFFKHLVYKEIFEQNFYYAPETIQEFVDFYNLNQLNLNMYQKAALFFIMPYASMIAGRLDLTQTCFEIILQEKVHLKKHSSPVAVTFQDEIQSLGICSLGKNTMLGNQFSDYNPQLLIEIGPLSESNLLLSFLYGTNKKVIEWLIRLFIQADLITNVLIILKKQDESFILGEEPYESRLNYSTFI